MQSSIQSLRLTLENNRNILVERLRAFTGVKVTKPDGTFYTFPDFSAYQKDSQKLARFLLAEGLVDELALLGELDGGVEVAG